MSSLATTSVPTDGGVGTNESTVIMGDFSRLLIGMRSQIRVELFREPFASSLQYALIAHLRADIAVDHPAAFSKITGITP
jgi:HK97 family phage major capsid protein